MGMWSNAAKHAKSFGVKGFLYGAAIGAVVGVAALLMVAGAVSTLGALGVVSATLEGSGLAGMAGAGAQILANGLPALTLQATAFVAGVGAAAGAFIGSVCSATAGSIYGAATDESNPLPRVLDSAANKIITKSPQLAKAIAQKISMQEDAGIQLAQQGGAPQTAIEAPMIAQQPVMQVAAQAAAPEVETVTRKPAVAPAASFQERMQSKDTELAAAQR